MNESGLPPVRCVLRTLKVAPGTTPIGLYGVLVMYSMRYFITSDTNSGIRKASLG